VIYSKYRAIFPVANRDVTAMKVSRCLSNGTHVLYGQTINHRDRPRTSTHIRIKGRAGFYCIPLNNEPYTTKMIGFFVGNPMAYIPTWVINLAKSKAPAIFRVLGKILIEQYGKPHLRPPPAIKPLKREQITSLEITPQREITVTVTLEEIEQLRTIREDMREILQVLVQNTQLLNKRMHLLIELKKKEKSYGDHRLTFSLLVGWPLLVFIVYNFFRYRGGNFLRSLFSRLKFF